MFPVPKRKVSRKSSTVGQTETMEQSSRAAPPSPPNRLQENLWPTPRAAHVVAPDPIPVVGAVTPQRSSRRAASVASSPASPAVAVPWTAARQRPAEEEEHEGAGRAVARSKHPDSSKWDWTPCENRPELLTYHDGKKRWFHCSKCEYWNDRLYHTKMHYERIHVKQGRSMPRKRKYVDPGEAQDAPLLRSPNIKPSAGSMSTTLHRHGDVALMETTPKGKGITANSNKNTPSLTKSANGSSPSPCKLARGKQTSPNAKASPAKRSNAVGRGAACSSLNVVPEVDQSTSRVFKFGSIFFQDDRMSGLTLDVAKMPRCNSVKHRSLDPKAVFRPGKSTISPKSRGASVVPAPAPAAAVHSKKRPKFLVPGTGAASHEASQDNAAVIPTSKWMLMPSSTHAQPLNNTESSSSGLSDTSPVTSPMRAYTGFAPVTPVRECSNHLEPSPALGHGMLVLSGGVPHQGSLTHGALLSSTVSVADRRAALRFNGGTSVSSLLFSPDSSASKMLVPQSPPMTMSGVMSGMQSHPVTPTIDRFMSVPMHISSTVPSAGSMMVRGGASGREGSSDIFGALISTTPSYPSNLYCSLGGQDALLACTELLENSFH